jgi:low temperature requirement protein LtrA
MSRDRGLLRIKTGKGHHRVSFVELFFDLVFVFAVTQLSHRLIEHFTVLGAAETLLLTLAVWWVWMYTAWWTNWLDPERRPVCFALLAMMLAGIILSSSIPKAFEGRGLAFAGAYTAIQLGRTGFFLWAARGHDRLLTNFQRIFAWLALSAVFWIAGALRDGHERLLLWALAFGLEFLSPAVGFWTPGLGCSTTEDWDVEGGHMAERSALFIIIALGESILVTGATFADLAWTTATVAAFVVSFAGSLTMWWLYFDVVAESGNRTIAASSDPGRVARLSYTYIHLLLVAGIILAAVADEFVLAHPTGHADAKTAIAIIGSAALYLLGHALFAWSIAGRVPAPSIAGIVAVLSLTAIAAAAAPVVLSAVVTAVLIVVAVVETREQSRAGGVAAPVRIPT